MIPKRARGSKEDMSELRREVVEYAMQIEEALKGAAELSDDVIRAMDDLFRFYIPFFRLTGLSNSVSEYYMTQTTYLCNIIATTLFAISANRIRLPRAFKDVGHV